MPVVLNWAENEPPPMHVGQEAAFAVRPLPKSCHTLTAANGWYIALAVSTTVPTLTPARPMIDSMNKLGVQVGRSFPALPNHMRVTIGKQSEMEAFLTAFREICAA